MRLSSRGKLLLSASLITMSGVVAQDASAQDLAAPATGAYQLDPIRIEASAAQDLLGNTEIDEDDIEDRNPSTIKDVFQGESSITASGGAAIGEKVFVNGIEESLLSVTIDGARQNKSAFHHSGNVLLDPALLKSVEVSEGIAPADAGPGALAGSIAYTTKDARDFLEPGDLYGGFVSAEVGTNGQDFRGSLALAGQLGNFEYLLSTTRQIGDAYEDGDGDEVPGTEPDVEDYLAKVAYTSDTGHRFSFSASKTEDTGERAAQAGPGGLLFIRPDFASVVGRDSVFIDGLARRTSYIFDYTDEQPEGWLAPSFQLTYNKQEIDAGGVYGENESFSGTLSNEFALSNGTVNAGLDFFDESTEGEIQGEPPFDMEGEETMWNVGVFAQARQDLTDRISVSYGGRYDYQEFEGVDGSDFDGDGLSANGSVDVILTQNIIFNAGYASSWGGYELGKSAVVNLSGPWTYDGFTSSRANAGRVGLRFESGPFTASGAYFKTDVDDITAVLPEAGERGATSDATSEGFDGSLAYEGGRGFVRLNYTYADVELNGDTIGSTAYYIGRPVGHLFGLSGGYEFNDQWQAGASAEIALDNDDTAIDLDGYEVVDIYAAYSPRQYQNLQVRFDIRNLFDETFADRSSDGIDTDATVPLNEPGRTFAVTARVMF